MFCVCISEADFLQINQWTENKWNYLTKKNKNKNTRFRGVVIQNVVLWTENNWKIIRIEADRTEKLRSHCLAHIFTIYAIWRTFFSKALHGVSDFPNYWPKQWCHPLPITFKKKKYRYTFVFLFTLMEFPIRHIRSFGFGVWPVLIEVCQCSYSLLPTHLVHIGGKLCANPLENIMLVLCLPVIKILLAIDRRVYFPQAV